MWLSSKGWRQPKMGCYHVSAAKKNTTHCKHQTSKKPSPDTFELRIYLMDKCLRKCLSNANDVFWMLTVQFLVAQHWISHHPHGSARDIWIIHKFYNKRILLVLKCHPSFCGMLCWSVSIRLTLRRPQLSPSYRGWLGLRRLSPQICLWHPASVRTACIPVLDQWIDCEKQELPMWIDGKNIFEWTIQLKLQLYKFTNPSVHRPEAECLLQSGGQSAFARV